MDIKQRGLFGNRLWQAFKEETKDIEMSTDNEQLEYNIWLEGKLCEVCGGEQMQQRFSNCNLDIVSESFAAIGRTILCKDVFIERDLNQCKRFVVNGEMLHNTDRLYHTILKNSR
jgi:hypothetical protein